MFLLVYLSEKFVGVGAISQNQLIYVGRSWEIPRVTSNVDAVQILVNTNIIDAKVVGKG
jgi:hypothetical protein